MVGVSNKCIPQRPFQARQEGVRFGGLEREAGPMGSWEQCWRSQEMRPKGLAEGARLERNN